MGPDFSSDLSSDQLIFDTERQFAYIYIQLSFDLTTESILAPKLAVRYILYKLFIIYYTFIHPWYWYIFCKNGSP